jgi:hypothetical protein
LSAEDLRKLANGIYAAIGEQAVRDSVDAAGAFLDYCE